MPKMKEPLQWLSEPVPIDLPSGRTTTPRYDYNILGTSEEDVVEITKNDSVITTLKGHLAVEFIDAMNRAFDSCEVKYRHTAYWIECGEVQDTIKSFINKQE